MKSMITLILLASLFVPSAQANNQTAATVHLFTIANDRDSNIDRFQLSLDGRGFPTGVIYQAEGHNNSHSFADISRGEGVVLIEGQGRKVVLLSGRPDANGEGRFRLTYLANGLSGRYESCDLLIKRAGGSWIAQNAYTNQRITAATIVTHTLGLRTLQGICPAE